MKKILIGAIFASSLAMSEADTNLTTKVKDESFWLSCKLTSATIRLREAEAKSKELEGNYKEAVSKYDEMIELLKEQEKNSCLDERGSNALIKLAEVKRQPIIDYLKKHSSKK